MPYHYIIAYDICDPARLRRAHRICEDFGQRIQLSVFACQLSDLQRADIEAKLAAVIRPTEDQVMFVRLKKVRKNQKNHEVPGIETIGRSIRWKQDSVVII